MRQNITIWDCAFSHVTNITCKIFDVVSLLVTGNIHGCLSLLISSFKLHQIGIVDEGKIDRMLSKLSEMWSIGEVCNLRFSKYFEVSCK